jgi:hypothetical protein
MLWSVPGGSAYEDLPTTAVSAGRFSAPVARFSRGVLGRGNTGDAAPPPNDAATDTGPTDSGGEGGSCAPYAGACSPATTGPHCCNDVPCVNVVDEGGSHYACLFGA